MTVIPTHSLSSFPSRFHSIPVTGHFLFSCTYLLDSVTELSTCYRTLPWARRLRVDGQIRLSFPRCVIYVSESQTSTDAELWLLRQYGIIVYTAPVCKHASANYRKEVTIPGGCSSLRFIILSSADKVVGSDQITRRTRVLCRYLPARLPS